MSRWKSLRERDVYKRQVDALRAEQPELPNARCKRYMFENKLPRFDANLLVENRDRGDLFDAAAALGAPAKACLLYTSRCV